MKMLVVGSGGREHALVWKLAQSPHITHMWCAPGNAGIAGERLARNLAPVECVDIGAEDLPLLADFAREKTIDLTVVEPDAPLALGIVDLFQQHRLRIWGPDRKAALFESSKVFSQNSWRSMDSDRAPESSPRSRRRRISPRLWADDVR